jgi:predicted phage-related endonuclease
MRFIRKPAHSSLEWQRKRHRDDEGRVVFGASEAPALMGASPFSTTAELLVRKMGNAQVSIETSPAMRTGNLVEPVLIREASEVLGVEFVTPDWMFGRGRFVATPDGIDALSATSLDKHGDTIPAFWVEAKCTGRHRVKSLDDVPAQWLWQIAAQSYVLGGHTPMYLVVLDADLHINVIEIPRNIEAEERLVETAERLGASVDAGEIPEEIVPLMSADEVASIWKATEDTVELPEEAADWLLTLEEAKDLKRQADDLEERAKAWLAQQMRGASVATFRGAQAITWREQAGRSSLDSKRLADEHPEIVEAYTRRGEPFRVMRLSNKWRAGK